MIIKCERGMLYICRVEGSRFFADTRDRKAFIMRKEYVATDDNGKEIKCVCKTTHQDPKKSSFGGFGFEIL